jgi:tetratricopeptide (TPR) repeat protein
MSKFKKILLGIIIILSLIAITLGFLGSELKNSPLAITAISIGGVAVVLLIMFIFSVSLAAKSNAKGFEEFYQEGDYEGGIEFYNKIYKESPNGKEKAQAAYYLMTFYFLVNDLDSARDLFGDAEFGVFEDYVLYYDILLDLYDGMVGDAREKYNKFMDLNRNELAERKNILNQIFDFIDDKIDTINLQSDYPIIKDIIERYAEE